MITGKKKLHPEYIGQLEIQVKGEKLIVNYDAEAAYYLIGKIAWTEKYAPYNKELRHRKVLEIFH